jgi:hypothetical protein
MKSACVVLAGIIGLQPVSAGTRSAAEFFRGRAFDALRKADKVESYTVASLLVPGVDPNAPHPEAVETDLPGLFKILNKPQLVPKPLASSIAALLLDPSSYATDSAVPCAFDPDRMIRFWRNGQALDVFVDSRCGNLAFQEKGAKKALSQQIYFAPSRSRLMPLLDHAIAR